jgi:hypothetical protein
MLIEQKRRTEIDLSKVIYDTWYEGKENWTMTGYLKKLSLYCPTNTFHYYRILFEVYRYFVIQNNFKPSDLYLIDIWDLYGIKSTKKGIFDKFTLIDTIKYFNNMSLNREQRESYLWELKDRRGSLTSTIRSLKKRYDADVAEKYSLMHEASKEDAGQTV